jgi:hypothetical protein
MLLSMLSLPLITSLSIGVGGRKVGVTGTNILVLGTLFLCTLFSFTLSSEVILSGSPVSIEPLK